MLEETLNSPKAKPRLSCEQNMPMAVFEVEGYRRFSNTVF